MAESKIIAKKDPDNPDTTILSRWPTEAEKVAASKTSAPKPKSKSEKSAPEKGA